MGHVVVSTCNIGNCINPTKLIVFEYSSGIFMTDIFHVTIWQHFSFHYTLNRQVTDHSHKFCSIFKHSSVFVFVWLRWPESNCHIVSSINWASFFIIFAWKLMSNNENKMGCVSKIRMWTKGNKSKEQFWLKKNLKLAQKLAVPINLSNSM